jgi:hypothetical protein
LERSKERGVEEMKSKSNDAFGWDFQDHLEALLEPDNHVTAIKNIVFTIVFFIPIICYIFLSFFIASIVGFSNIKKREKNE